MNKKFYEDVVLKTPHTLEPDTLSKNPKPAHFVYMRTSTSSPTAIGRWRFTHVDNGHAANLLMSYLPKEKLLLITDIFNDFGMPRPNDPPPGLVSPYYAALGNRIKELKLDVERLAPLHGRAVVSVDMLNGASRSTSSFQFLDAVAEGRVVRADQSRRRIVRRGMPKSLKMSVISNSFSFGRLGHQEVRRVAVVHVVNLHRPIAVGDDVLVLHIDKVRRLRILDNVSGSRVCGVLSTTSS